MTQSSTSTNLLIFHKTYSLFHGYGILELSKKLAGKVNNPDARTLALICKKAKPFDEIRQVDYISIKFLLPEHNKFVNKLQQMDGKSILTARRPVDVIFVQP